MRALFSMFVVLGAITLASEPLVWGESYPTSPALLPYGGRDYMEYKSATEKGVTYREYRQGPMVGRVEKMKDGRAVKTWKGRAEMEEDARKPIVVNTGPGVEEEAKRRLDNYNAESLLMIAESSKKPSAEDDPTPTPSKRENPQYNAPYNDGFTSENTIVLTNKATNSAKP